MYADYNWSWMPGLDQIVEKERVKEAKEKEEQEKARLKAEAEIAEKEEKRKNDENQMKKGNETNQNKNTFDLLVDYVKNDFLDDKVSTIPSISIKEYAKLTNREVHEIKVRSTTKRTEWPPFFPEFSDGYKPVRTKHTDLDLSEFPHGPSDTFGTRNFLPPLMVGVAFFSLAMILFALCRWELYGSSRRKRKPRVSTPTKSSNPEEGYELEESTKLNTFEPSAPAEPELRPEAGEDPAKTTLVCEENNRAEEGARAITDFRLRYQMAASARKSANSLALLPLLEHVFGRPANECENCRHPFASQRCHSGGNHRAF